MEGHLSSSGDELEDDPEYQVIFQDGHDLFLFFTNASFLPNQNGKGMRLTQYNKNNDNKFIFEKITIDSSLTSITFNNQEGEMFDFFNSIVFDECVGYIKRHFEMNKNNNELQVMNGNINNSNNSSYFPITLTFQDPIYKCKNIKGIRSTSMTNKNLITMIKSHKLESYNSSSDSLYCQGLLVTDAILTEDGCDHEIIANSVIKKIDQTDITRMQYDSVIRFLRYQLDGNSVEIEYQLPINVLFVANATQQQFMANGSNCNNRRPMATESQCHWMFDTRTLLSVLYVLHLRSA